MQLQAVPKSKKWETPDSIRFPGRTSQAKAAPAKAAETSFEEVGLLGDKLLIGAIPTKLLQRKRKWVELDLLMRSKPRLISQKGFV
jgi:hypothetical protein